MQREEDWNLGRKEIVCVFGGSGVLAVLSLLLKAAPPWWFLPLPSRAARHFDRWAQYAEKGGYSEFWMQSLVGWTILGAILGLIFSNVILRGKSWD